MTMSGFIPIVSSSPPPLDESTVNNNSEDDWDDFAQFTGTSDVAHEESGSVETCSSHVGHETALDDVGTDTSENHIKFGAFDDQVENSENAADWATFRPIPSEHAHSSVADCDFNDFAAFKGNSEATDSNTDEKKSEEEQNKLHVNDYNLCTSQPNEEESSSSSPEECDVPKGQTNSDPQTGHRSESQDVTSLGSATDSGLSSDISPVTKATDIGEHFVAKIEDLVCCHDSKTTNGDSGAETDDRGATSCDDHSKTNSVIVQSSDSDQFVTEQQVSEHSSVCSDDDQIRKSSGDKCVHTSETVTEQCLDKSSEVGNNSSLCDCSAEVEYGSNDDDQSSKLTCNVVLPSVSSCHDGQNVERENADSILSDTESIHKHDLNSDVVNQVDSGDGDVSTRDATSCPDDPHQSDSSLNPRTDAASDQRMDLELQADDDVEFRDFEDAVESQTTEGDDEGSEPDLEEFHFKQSSNVGEDDSPVESLDLKLPGTDAATPQGDADEWGDDFADFQEAGNLQQTATKEVNSNWAAFDEVPTASETGDNWAEFNEAESPAKTTDLSKSLVTSEDDVDFGDFEDVPPDSFQPCLTSTASILQALGNVNHIKKILTNVFHGDDVTSSEYMDIDLLLQCMERSRLKTNCSERKTSSKDKTAATDVCVWNNLRDISNTAALKYTWNNSNNRQKLLQACSIDTRNILLGHKKPSVPIFYQQAVLEPSRGPLEPSKGSTPSSPSVDSLVPDTSAVTQSVISQSTAVTGASNSTVSGAGTPQDIPPAEFDWSSSGLTNPLDALQQEQEILQALETSPEGKPKPPKTLKSIETLLAGMNFTPTAPASIANNEEPISAEAKRILDTLPDLSFMHASVLMFPLKVNSELKD